MGAEDLGWPALPPRRWDLGQHGNPPSFRRQMGGGGLGLMNAGTNPHGNSENIPEDGQAVRESRTESPVLFLMENSTGNEAEGTLRITGRDTGSPGPCLRTRLLERQRPTEVSPRLTLLPHCHGGRGHRANTGRPSLSGLLATGNHFWSDTRLPKPPCRLAQSF